METNKRSVKPIINVLLLKRSNRSTRNFFLRTTNRRNFHIEARQHSFDTPTEATLSLEGLNIDRSKRNDFLRGKMKLKGAS